MKETGDDIIIGRNPVIEALKAGREIEKLCVARGTEGTINKIIKMARDKNVPVQYVDKRALDNISQENHQGVAAYVSSYSYCDIEDITERAESLGEDLFIVILDGVEDPHNLGAIMRTAEAAGVHGIIIPKRRAASVNSTAVKVSAGASEHILCAKVTNIAQTIDKLKDMGIWIAACDMDGETYYNSNVKGKIGLVIGGEGTGIGSLIKQKCDFTVSIPMKGKVNSLNVSNAAAILIYEVRRQRDGK